MEVTEMIKVIGTIVNSNLMLVGLTLKDGDNVVRYNLQTLADAQFKNNQVEFSNGRLKLINGFKLNSIPMEVFMGDTFVPMNNDVTIIGRVNNGAEDTGYVVKTGTGHTVTIDIKQLKSINDIFKPTNFVVNRREDTGKLYLTSKPGCPKISELPIVAGIAKQFAQRTAKKNVAQVNGNLSFWNLASVISSMNGCFIKLPHVKYNSETKMAVPDSAKAQDISNYGEFALPEFEVVTTNANLNLSFRAQVKVEITDVDDNKLFDVWSNKISTKTVYKNGKPMMSEIGIMVKNTVRDQLFATLEGYDYGKVDDAQLRKFYAKTAGKGNADDLTIVWLSLKNIPAFSAADIANMRQQMSKPNVFVKDLFDYTCVKKALTQFSKIKREAIKAGSGIKTVSPELAQYSPEQLKAIASAGIDTTYNSYTFKAEKTATSEDGKETKADYAIKWEFTSLKTVNVTANEKLKTDVEALCDVLRQAYAAGKADEANAYIAQTKDAANRLAKAIQIWNIVCLFDGDFKFVKVPSGVQVVPGKTNKYMVINTGDKLFEQARAAVAGWDVQ